MDISCKIIKKKIFYFNYSLHRDLLMNISDSYYLSDKLSSIINTNNRKYLIRKHLQLYVVAFVSIEEAAVMQNKVDQINKNKIKTAIPVQLHDYLFRMSTIDLIDVPNKFQEKRITHFKCDI